MSTKQNTVHVMNIPNSWTCKKIKNVLKEMVNDHAKVKRISVNKNKNNNNQAFIALDDPKDVPTVIMYLHEKLLDGRIIKCQRGHGEKKRTKGGQTKGVP